MQTDLALDETPAGRRRQRVRESIIAAAERVFAQEGEEGLSIRRLAEEIDYSPAAIYKYFGSKEELVDELKEAFFERLLTRVDQTSSADKPFADRARSCVTTYIETATARPYHYAAAFSSIQPEKPCADAEMETWEQFTQTRKGQAFQVLVDMVLEGQALGIFDTELDPVMAAKSVWAAMHGLAQLLTHLPQFADFNACGQSTMSADFVARHADFVFRGLQRSAEPVGSGASGRIPS